MKQLIYVMQFKGTAAPKSGVSGVIKASTRAASSSLSSIISSAGVTTTLMQLDGDSASFESEVTITGESSFRESGTIRFGDSNHNLRFSTIGEGFLGKSPDPALQHGSVMWRVDGGEGSLPAPAELLPRISP